MPEEQLVQIVAWFQQLPDALRLAAIGTVATVVLLDEDRHVQLTWLKFLAERLGIGVQEWPGLDVRPADLPN